jgi:NADP-dependent 3-hydroxy acid dehydrogenase YdfG
MMNQGSFALVSGASSGIGQATARELASKGYSLILLSRRADRLQKFAQSLLSKYPQQKFLSVSCDVSKAQELERKLSELQPSLETLQILVNAAGSAKGVDKVDEAKLSDWDEMIDTNVKGLMHLTRHCLPYFKKQKSGFIVNLGSVAGRYVYPGGAVYCASKFAVRAFTEGLRQDLLGSQIRVCNIEPGMVETEFSLVRLGSETKSAAVYANMTPLTAEDIARTILWVVEQPKHVNIQELVIYPTDQAHVGQVHRRT